MLSVRLTTAPGVRLTNMSVYLFRHIRPRVRHPVPNRTQRFLRADACAQNSPATHTASMMVSALTLYLPLSLSPRDTTRLATRRRKCAHLCPTQLSAGPPKRSTPTTPGPSVRLTERHGYERLHTCLRARRLDDTRRTFNHPPLHRDAPGVCVCVSCDRVAPRPSFCLPCTACVRKVVRS